MKTKTMKRLAAAVAAITMMSAVPMSAFPVSVDAASITIGASGDNVTHQYVAYQIFKGERTAESGNDDLLNIDWSANLSDGNKTAILNLLGASSVSTAITKLKASTDLRALSSGIYKIVKDNVSSSFSGNKLNNIDDGYYLIVDTTAVNTNDTANSFNMLKVAGDATIGPKIVVPELHKKIRTSKDDVTPVTWGSENTASVGDTVYYKLESKVPDMTGYSKYFFAVEDTMTNGLTLNYDIKKSDRDADNGKKFTVTIKDGAKTDTLEDITNINGSTDETPYSTSNGTQYYVVPSNDKKSFRLVFVNFVQYTKNAEITIEYNASLNSDGLSYDVAATGANNNSSNLIYSNNPNFEYLGNPGASNNDSGTPNDETKPRPDEPNPGQPDDNAQTLQDERTPDPTSKTTEETVHTYTAKVKIDKVDGQELALTGADFNIYSDSGCTIKLDKITKTGDTSGSEFMFSGLGEGTYYIKEDVVPTGFNGLTAPLTLEVSATLNSGCEWKVGDTSTKISGNNVFSVDDSIKYQYNATVKNQAGATLPSTGGIGTTIFYVSGGVLVLGAGVVLITKKRMSAKEDK